MFDDCGRSMGENKMSNFTPELNGKLQRRRSNALDPVFRIEGEE